MSSSNAFGIVEDYRRTICCKRGSQGVREKGEREGGKHAERIKLEGSEGRKCWELSGG